MTYEICNKELRGTIAGILEEHVGISAEATEFAFDQFRGGKHEKPYPEILKIPIDKLKYKQKLINLDTACCHGIDIPIWYEHENPSSRIMIIAMDPRRDATIENVNRRYADTNSPFTLHLHDENQYWNNIKPLLETNSVYVTDAYKLYYRLKNNTDTVSNSIRDYKKSDIHRKTLEAEIDAFKPDFIICLGGDSFNAMKIILDSKVKETITKAKFINIAKDAKEWKTPVFGILHNSRANAWLSKYLEDLEKSHNLKVDRDNYYIKMIEHIKKLINQ